MSSTAASSSSFADDIEVMTAGKIKPLVDRTGRESQPYQFAREHVQNSLEADAKTVEIHPEWGAVEAAGVYRYLHADDGKGMTARQLSMFLNKFGGGGKAIGGEHDNYGMGSKSSTLPGNHFGVIVASRVGGETNLILLRYNDQVDEYGAVRWVLDDDESTDAGEYSTTLPLDEVPRDTEIVKYTTAGDILDAFIDSDHGTVTVLCGMRATHDTFLATGAGADFTEVGKQNGVLKYLTQRYWAPTLDIRVWHFADENRANWPRTAAEAREEATAVGSIRIGEVIGLGRFLEKGGRNRKTKQTPESMGVVQLSDGGKAHWFLLADGCTYNSQTSAGHAWWNGGVATLYAGEVYDHPDRRAPRLRSFGISRDAAQKRITIIVEPPINNGGEGVYPDSARSRLLWTGGRNLPWARWGEEFYDNLPPEIERAIADAAPTPDDDEESIPLDSNRLEEAVERMARGAEMLFDGATTVGRKIRRTVSRRRTKVTRSKVTEPGGTGTGTGTGTGDGTTTSEADLPDTNGEREAEVLVDDPNGEETEAVVKRPPRPEHPTLVWVKGNEYRGDDSDPDHETDTSAARFVNPSNLVEANLGYGDFSEIVDYYSTEMGRDLGATSEQREAMIMREVRRVYELRLVGYVAHTQMKRKKGVLTQDEVEARLSSEALTAVCWGIMVEDLAIRSNLGAVAGKSRSKRNRKAKTAA